MGDRRREFSRREVPGIYHGIDHVCDLGASLRAPRSNCTHIVAPCDRAMARGAQWRVGILLVRLTANIFVEQPCPEGAVFVCGNLAPVTQLCEQVECLDAAFS